MPQNHPIAILGIAPDNSLILSDKGQTNVDPGDTVTWLLGPNSGVESITAITKKEDSTNVFKPEPAPVGGSKNWAGTVDPFVPKGSEELYNILWKADGEDVINIFDPKIQVNP
jgi:hypothetical protein